MSDKILLVEDDENLSLSTCYGLQTAGFQVITTSTGAEALAKVKEELPDLILLDVHLPDISGLEVCQQIKQDPQTARLPVIMMSVLNLPPDRIRGLKAGADDYVSKPFHLDELMLRISACLERVHTLSRPVESVTTVLLVEDEVHQARLQAFNLRSQGYRVILASSGSEALLKIKAEKPDLVLLDVMLPDGSGLEICRQIRAQESTAALPVILISALLDVEDKVKGLEAGADEYVPKPVYADELVARIESLLRRPKLSATSSSPHQRQIKILVVDDEPDLLRLNTFILETQGYQIDMAESGGEAISKIRNDPPDLVLLDVRLPDMSGLDICRFLREDERTAHLPVIMISALVEVEDRVKGLKAGADDYITKPVDAAELIARVTARLKREHQTNDTPMLLSRPGPAKILLVDDEPSSLRMLEYSLQLEGHEVMIAETGAEALREARDAQPDVILLDVLLPDMNGIEVCQTLRMQDATSHIPIFLLSVRAETADRLAGLKAGAQVFISKPVDADELLARVEAITRRSNEVGS